MMSIVVVGQNQSRLESIKTLLNNLKNQELKIIDTHPNHLSSNFGPAMKLLIIDTSTVNHLMFTYVNQIRQSGFSGSIVIIGEKNIKLENKDFMQIKNLFYIESHHIEIQLLGLVSNCLNIDGLRQRRDERFDVRESATLEAYNSDFKTDTIINNISKSGMRIEGELSGLNKGDLLRLHLQLDQLKKERQLSAKVVWLKIEGDKINEAGLQFVSQKDVYKYLLERAVA